MTPRSAARPLPTPAERRRDARALRKATAQLHEARRRAPVGSGPIPSVDIVLALRRAERRRAAEAEARVLREARRQARRRTRREARARRTGGGLHFPLGLRPAASAAGLASLLALVGSLASLWVIG